MADFSTADLIRLGVWKVVLGTMVVGLAGVLIPGLVSFYTTYFESLRKNAELSQAQQLAHQQYIKDFFETAVNQDIELRIRFANYFANLSGADQRQLWQSYRDSQTETRDKLRSLINEIEHKITLLNPEGKNEFSTPEAAAEYKQLERERTWAYREIGYVAIQSNAVSAFPKRASIVLNSQQTATMQAGLSANDLVNEKIDQIPGLLEGSCPGGASGRNPNNYATLVAISNSTKDRLRLMQTALQVCAQNTITPQQTATIRAALSANNVAKEEVNKISGLVERNCPGGASGMNPFNYPAVVEGLNIARDQLSQVQSALEVCAHLIP